jgi:hypothetical protein
LESVERGPVVGDLLGNRGDEFRTLGVVLQDGGEEVPRAMCDRWGGDGGGRTREVQKGDEMIAAKLRVVEEGSTKDGDRGGGVWQEPDLVEPRRGAIGVHVGVCFELRVTVPKGVDGSETSERDGHTGFAENIIAAQTVEGDRWKGVQVTEDENGDVEAVGNLGFVGDEPDEVAFFFEALGGGGEPGSGGGRGTIDDDDTQGAGDAGGDGCCDSAAKGVFTNVGEPPRDVGGDAQEYSRGVWTRE